MRVILELGVTHTTLVHNAQELPAIAKVPLFNGMPGVVIQAGAIRVEIKGEDWDYLLQQMAKVTND